ncbi:hypothetical protein BDB00DRAFT_882974 [Zychaea mexicana]|uniref:uncharacterized protein n=1 Tax=Zychaea mexicana TaxID=64656 RepID=UPI0022FEFE5F|nr:uncharacterized protein BDB00DRAFT_882974 [Zychaea mexicana]KAI9493753.1 hypothetical protein BDB00DRAFT_882974 [Zychaea mexicana]
MSPKSRRSQRNKAAAVQAAEEARPRPRLHAHHRIRSDPFGVEPPLTIDQHLSNYHQSLLSPSARTERMDVHHHHPSGLSLSSPPSAGTAAAQATAVFYQHRPLTLLANAENPAGQGPPFPFTLLHPPIKDSCDQVPNHRASAVRENDRQAEGGGGRGDGNSGGGLLQLAHVVSTFG